MGVMRNGDCDAMADPSTVCHRDPHDDILHAAPGGPDGATRMWVGDYREGANDGAASDE